MIDRTIEILLILLVAFTPIAFGSQVLWAFSLMELGILLIIILWALGGLRNQFMVARSITDNQSLITSNRSRIANNYVLITALLLSMFLGLVLLQMIPLPAGLMRIISARTYELRNQLSVINSATSNESLVTTLSFFPLATKIEFFKWLALAGLFVVLLQWRFSDGRRPILIHLIVAIFLVGVFESLYGIFEYSSGHRHILNLDYSSRISSVTGTFANRNCFAGYLLMVIPLSTGFLFFRGAHQQRRFRYWRQRLSSLDGKTLLLIFGIILMILGLLLSASRAGILSLMLAFSLIVLFFKDPHRREGISRVPLMILGLALLWAALIGLDSVISRFFTVSDDFRSRWILWENTIGILKDFPLLGSGLGTFTEVFSMYRSSHIVTVDIQAENDFLQLASEAGLMGAGMLFVLFLFLLFKAVSGVRSLSPEEPQRYIGIACLVGILALMFHSLVQKNLQLPANAFLFTVMWAIVLRVGLGPGSKRMTEKV